ncbi:MAG: ketoacyl-ACP synthase III [Mediterranea massiliensis]|nr:ketoacyl-ACP synthase III [Mediterranea massiliensis]
MALFSVKRTKIVGFSAGVPQNTVYISDVVKNGSYDASDFASKTGIQCARISNEFTASDLCLTAAEKLISDLSWNKSEIDAIIFVSQHPDYILPATSCVLQERLGLNKECYAMDISLGCSGWIYGLSVVTSLVSNGGIKKALLMSGDAKKRVAGELDPLFGFAGTVTAVEYTGNDKDIIDFHTGTDGSGYDAIIIPDGGSRNQMTKDSFELENVEGKQLHRLQTRMKGMDVFSFGISVAPKSVKKLLEYTGTEVTDYDYVVFHQANMMMNEKIRKKLKLDTEKVPYSLPTFGNTSSASIPLTIVTQLKDIAKDSTRFLACGFGVGLSWGTVAFTTENLVISDLVEL